MDIQNPLYPTNHTPHPIPPPTDGNWTPPALSYTADILSVEVEFPKGEVYPQLLREYRVVYCGPPRIAVIGLSAASIAVVVDAILSTKCVDHETVGQLRSRLIRSQYDVDDATINELAERANVPRYLRYFPVLKDDLTAWERECLPRRNLLHPTATCIDPDPEDAVVPFRRDSSDSSESTLTLEPSDLMYNRLGKYTRKTLEREKYLDYRAEYGLLFYGFIREMEMRHGIQIPLDLVELIQLYYDLKQPQDQTIDSYKLNGDNGEIFELCAVHNTSLTLPRYCQRVQGTIYVFDLTTYHHCFRDENGRTEYLWCGQKRIQRRRPKLVFLTNFDRFREQIQSIPLNVCPLFSGYHYEDCPFETCLEGICAELAAWFGRDTSSMLRSNLLHLIPRDKKGDCIVLDLDDRDMLREQLRLSERKNHFQFNQFTLVK